MSSNKQLKLLELARLWLSNGLCYFITAVIVLGLLSVGAANIGDKTVKSLEMTKNMNDIYNIILHTKNFSNRSGYIIQARSDPKRLIFVSEKLVTESPKVHSNVNSSTHENQNNISEYVIHAKYDPNKMLILNEGVITEAPNNSSHSVDFIHSATKVSEESTVLPSPERLPVKDVHIHLYLTDNFLKPLPYKVTSDDDYQNTSSRILKKESPKKKTYKLENVRLKRQHSRRETTIEEPISEEALQAMKRVIFIRCPFYACPRGHICDYHTRSCRPIYYPDYDY